MYHLSKMWIVLSVMIIIAQAHPQKIELKNLGQLLEKQSPKLKNLRLEYEYNLKEFAEAFRWDDPEFEFEQEKLSNALEKETERSYVFQQNIKMPWVIRSQGKLHRTQQKIAKLAFDQSVNEFVSEMKSGYLQIKLMSEDLQQLAAITESLENISRIARHQSGEGAISGLDAGLIRMATLNIRKEYLELERERNSLVANWAIDAGFNSEAEIDFAGELPAQNFEYSIDALRNIADENSRLLQIENIKTSVHQRKVALEKGKILPELGLSVGYKKVNSDFDGYIVGLALPIPLWNRNSLNVQKEKIHSKLQENEQQMAKAKIFAKIANLQQMVNEYDALRKNMETELQTSATDFDKAISAYREGWIRLNDLLDAAEIFASFIRTQSELTQNYFDTIFELETIIGRPLIQY